MKIKKHGIFWGVILVLIALSLILRSFEIVPFGIGTIILGGIMVAIFVSSLVSVQFTGMLFAAAHIYHIIVKEFEIPNLPYGWTIILGGTLLGIGLDILFRGSIKKSLKKKKNPHFNINFDFSDEDRKNNSEDDVVCDTEFHNNFGDGSGHISGEKIEIENAFGKTTKYVSSENFKYASIDNGFGDLTVYFDNVTFQNNQALLDIDNGFGNTLIYVPSAWRIELDVDSGFGKVKINGVPSTDENAPVLYVKADNGFGNIEITCN